MVAIVVRGGRFLVIRRSDRVVAPRAYCFPGGGIEGDESDQQALVREVREELNVTVRPLVRLWQSVTPWGVQLSWWHSELPDNAQPDPNPTEVESVHWCTPEEMARLEGLLESNRDFLRALKDGKIDLAP